MKDGASDGANEKPEGSAPVEPLKPNPLDNDQQVDIGAFVKQFQET